jgi:NRPS condensation-like uncharacterized protein
VINATCPTTGDKVFGEKLTQVPRSFGGFHFWQNANYFLVHEHIREIETPTNDDMLKKFVATVMKLPFPNKRPLWEILVFSNYNSNSSALVFRVHQAVTDEAGLLSVLCAITNGTLKSNVPAESKIVEKSFEDRDDGIFAKVVN